MNGNLEEILRCGCNIEIKSSFGWLLILLEFVEFGLSRE